MESEILLYIDGYSKQGLWVWNGFVFEFCLVLAEET